MTMSSAYLHDGVVSFHAVQHSQSHARQVAAQVHVQPAVLLAVPGQGQSI